MHRTPRVLGVSLPAGAVLLCLLMVGFASQPLEAGVTGCAGTAVSVDAEDGADTAAGCAGAADAIGFLGSLGLQTAHAIEIRFVDSVSGHCEMPSALGCFTTTDRKIHLLTFAQMRGRLLGDRLPIDRALHRGLVAHEVAHRIARANFEGHRPSVVGMEYIAYATMLATLPDPARQGMLALSAGDGFDSEREVSLTVLLLDPNRFAAEAYRHFIRPQHGRAFIERILAGTALVRDEPN